MYNFLYYFVKKIFSFCINILEMLEKLNLLKEDKGNSLILPFFYVKKKEEKNVENLHNYYADSLWVSNAQFKELYKALDFIEDLIDPSKIASINYKKQINQLRNELKENKKNFMYIQDVFFKCLNEVIIIIMLF